MAKDNAHEIILFLPTGSRLMMQFNFLNTAVHTIFVDAIQTVLELNAFYACPEMRKEYERERETSVL